MVTTITPFAYLPVGYMCVTRSWELIIARHDLVGMYGRRHCKTIPILMGVTIIEPEQSIKG